MGGGIGGVLRWGVDLEVMETFTLILILWLLYMITDLIQFYGKEKKP